MSRGHRQDIVLLGSRRALELRRELGVSPTDPLNPIDAAERMGLRVFQRDARSYDGCYSPPTIVLSSLRPAGRINFTCAHEIGHHVFRHGATVEEVLDNVAFRDQSPEEYLANSFAAQLLMPRSLVHHALKFRGLAAESLTPLEVMRVSNWLGVGYGTLLTHMRFQLKMLGQARFEELTSWRQPKAVKGEIAGAATGAEDVWLLDEHWGDQPLDCRLGDHNDHASSASDLTFQDGRLAETGTGTHGTTYQPVSVGLDQAQSAAGWKITTRCSRRGRSGWARYRYEPEDSDA